jgi:hypothetical protein
MGFEVLVSAMAGTGIDGTGSSARNGRDWPKRPELSEMEAGTGYKVFCTVLVTGTRRFGRSGRYRNGINNYAADALFAECWGHSAKPAKHSAKALPSAVLGKGLSAKILLAKISLSSAKNRHSAKSLPSAKPALGKKITAINI